MNRSRVHRLGAVLFLLGVLLFLFAIAIILIGDQTIASSMTDTGEFTELSTAMVKDAFRGMLANGELPSYILESMGAGGYSSMVNEVAKTILDRALGELGPVQRTLLLAWAHAPTIRLVGLIGAILGGVCWFVTGTDRKRVRTSASES